MQVNENVELAKLRREKGELERKLQLCTYALAESLDASTTMGRKEQLRYWWFGEEKKT